MRRRRRKDEVRHEAEQVGGTRERASVIMDIANCLKDGMASRDSVVISSTI